MKKIVISVLLPVILIMILSSCSTQPTSIPSPLPTTSILHATTITPVVTPTIDCSQSNADVEKWLRETTYADTLTVTALQAAGDLYLNPRDTGKQEALDWQKQTMEAYDFMKEYQSIPQCLVNYHDLVTETLFQLSMTFSELELTYVAMDANQDYESHLNAAKQFMSSALNASEASVAEWSRLNDLGIIPNIPDSTVLVSTSTPSTPASNKYSCTKEWSVSYLEDINKTIEKATKLTNDFGNTQTREQAESIAKQVDDLFAEVTLWEVPECGQKVQLKLMLVIGNIQIMQKDILNNDLAAFNQDYKVYETSVTQLNTEILDFSKSVK